MILIYSHKPQRSGRSITANTNNPPQDPPPPPKEVITLPVIEQPIVETPVVEVPVIETPIVEAPVIETPGMQPPVMDIPVIDIPIEDTTPPVPEVCPEEELRLSKPVDTPTPKISWFKRFVARIKKFFGGRK